MGLDAQLRGSNCRIQWMKRFSDILGKIESRSETYGMNTNSVKNTRGRIKK